MKITLTSDMSLVAVIPEYANVSLCNNSDYVIDLLLIDKEDKKRKLKLKPQQSYILPSSSEQQKIYGKSRAKAELIINL